GTSSKKSLPPEILLHLPTTGRRLNGQVRHSLVGIGCAAMLLVAGCGYRFSGGPGTSPFPADTKTIVIRSAQNNTNISGIEVEVTNALRREFALDSRLEPVRSGADVILKTVIVEFADSPSAYKADGKELTRSGNLKVLCTLERADSSQVLWKRTLLASGTYDVAASITETDTNRRRAISRMIEDLVPRIHRSMYDDF
ncbi:MAG: LptE family protein, partial [Thermodesulfobacteriota bacterium]